MRIKAISRSVIARWQIDRKWRKFIYNCRNKFRYLRVWLTSSPRRYKRLPFLNPDVAPPMPVSKLYVAIGIITSIAPLGLWMLSIIFLCATLYLWVSHSNWGLKPTFVEANSISLNIGFKDCLYFSVVTITTLGFGDYRPESYGRLIVSLEAISGLVLMGLFVSRLVSRKQDCLTNRILHGQLNAEIQDFRAQLTQLFVDFRSAPVALMANISTERLYKAAGLASSIARYWRHDAQHIDLPDVIPRRAAGRLFGDLLVLLEFVEIDVEGRSRNELHPHDINHIRRITESTLVTGTALADRINDKSIDHIYSNVSDLVKKLRVQLRLRRKSFVYPPADLDEYAK